MVKKIFKKTNQSKFAELMGNYTAR